jgi:hypothetical protein
VKTVLEVMKGARKILLKYQWIQGTYAEQKDGQSVDPGNPDATGFCLLGALVRAEGRDSYRAHGTAHSLAEDKLVQLIPAKQEQPSVADWQDEPKRTKKQVLALLDRAIRREAKK